MEKIDHHRRYFFGAAAMTIAVAQLGIADTANAQSANKRATQLPAIKPGTNTSFAPLKQRCRRPECGVRRSGPGRWSASHSSTRLALRHLQLCRCHAFVGVRWLPRARAFSARLRRDALSFERYVPQRPAVGSEL